jgi:arylsulfatase A-like enzyme
MEWFAATGTTHGSPYAYDTHVPLLFFGAGIAHGSSAEEADICDIAPTISDLLGIPFPSAATGKPLPLPHQTPANKK